MDSKVIEKLLAGIENESTRKGPPDGFPQLPDIPGGRYSDPEFQRLEREYLWKKSWLYAAHMDELPEAGSYKLWRRNGSPILLLRDQDDQVRAFYNVCRHRGGPLVTDAEGTVPGGLVCGFHGWTYDLSGQLINLRDKRDFVGLDMSCRNLVPVRCERLGNWIFVNEDPDAVPLAEYLGPVGEYFQGLPLASLRLVDQRTYTVHCNLKVLLDAFLEVYHLKSAHAGTVDRFLDYRGSNMILWPRGHSFMLTPNRRDWVDPGVRGMPEMDGATDIERYNNPSFNIYPNLVTPVAPSGLPFLLLWPETDGSMQLESIWFAPDWGDGPRDELWEERLSNFDRILNEDLQLAERIQESVTSPGFRGMPLNYQERRIYHWHAELDRRIGAEQIPENLRVEPVLDAWVTDGWS